MVQFKNVSKVYKDGTTAVKDVNFVIEEGEFVFLIGPSGSGKTTLIQLLIRDLVPSEGKIYLDDEDITHISRNKVYRHRRNIGVIFQDYKLIEDKTAYENVEFAMEAAGKSDREIKETVPYVLDIVGLGDRMDSFPVQLSGGEQQRVAIARAIANNPKLLIADEPTGNLDPASAWDIVQILTKINNWGTTILMSTHGTDIVNTLNKRVLQMEDGQLTRDDNEGQYEFNEKADPKQIEEIKASIKDSENKKKNLEVDIPKDAGLVPPKQEEKKVDKPKKKGLFGRFFRSDGESKDETKEEVAVEQAQDSSQQTTEESGKEESEDSETFAAKMNEMVEGKTTEEKSESKSQADSDTKEKDKDSGKFHFQLGNFKGTGLAADIEEGTSEENDKKGKKKETKEEKKLNEFYEKHKEMSVNFLNIPSDVIQSITQAGYKTVGQVLNDGPEKLLEDKIVDKDELVLIAGALEKLMDK